MNCHAPIDAVRWRRWDGDPRCVFGGGAVGFDGRVPPMPLSLRTRLPKEGGMLERLPATKWVKNVQLRGATSWEERVTGAS